MKYNSEAERMDAHFSLAERVKQYQARIAEYTRPTYNET